MLKIVRTDGLNKTAFVAVAHIVSIEVSDGYNFRGVPTGKLQVSIFTVTKNYVCSGVAPDFEVPADLRGFTLECKEFF